MLSGIVTLVRLLQLEKAREPILVTLSGIVTLVRLLQLQKACEPILVTLFGIVMLGRLPRLTRRRIMRMKRLRKPPGNPLMPQYRWKRHRLS